MPAEAISGGESSDRAAACADGRVFDPARLRLWDLGLRLTPSFSFGTGEPVFVVGHCFAQQIEHELARLGYAATGAGLEPIYGAPNILQTLRWASEGGFGERHLVRLGSGAWMNAHRAPFVPYTSAAAAMEVQEAALLRAREALRNVRVFVLILGSLEAWRDRETGAWLNYLPMEAWELWRAGRVERVRPTHAEVVGVLGDLFALVRRESPGAAVLAGLSPIPFDTVLGHDVLISDGYAKGTLRSALDEAIEAARAAGPADYLPTYELTALHPREDVYRPPAHGSWDGRHVHRRFVRQHVVRYLLDRYARAEEPT